MPSGYGGLIRQHSSKLGILQRVADGVCIASSLWLAAWLRNIGWEPQYSLAMIWGIALFLVSAEANNLYSSWRIHTLREEFHQVAFAWFVVVLALITFGFLTKTSADFSRVVMTMWFVFSPVLIVLLRVMVRTTLRGLRKHGRNTRTLAIAGSGKLAREVAGKVKQEKWMGLDLVGFYDDHEGASRTQTDKSVPLEGNLADLVAKATQGRIDFVYITLPMGDEKKIVGLVDELANTTTSVFLVPDLFVFDLLHSSWISLDGIPMISVFDTPFYGVDGWLKRFEDIVLASLILTLISIPMLVIAIATKLTSPGPVIFKQRRYGLNARVMEVWKFRTMTVCEDGEDIAQATKGDMRVTRLGAFLRRTSLDELPQFINVLQGRMSIVGPRPHAVSHNEKYRKLLHGYMLRHKVKPGITGWAQINGWRGETENLEKMKYRITYDMEYISNWSLWLDFKIIMRTLLIVVRDRNVY
jgi:putative colanic acid biosynthesis UDP-glucose lipid carrier transferase